MKPKVINLKREVLNKEPIIIYWLYGKFDSYKIAGPFNLVFAWINKNVDKRQPHLYHISILGSVEKTPSLYFLKRDALCKDKNNNVILKESYSDREKTRKLFGVSHPTAHLSLITYEQYLNEIIKGDCSLEYTVNCYNKKQRYALVQRFRRCEQVYKLIADFKTFPRHYIKELDTL